MQKHLNYLNGLGVGCYDSGVIVIFIKKITVNFEGVSS